MKVNHNTKTITATELELHMVANYLEHCVTDKEKWTVKTEKRPATLLRKLSINRKY